MDYAPVTRAALALYDAGIIPVFIPPGEKGPRVKNWQLKRPGRDDIIAHYEAYPDANLGVLEGPESGIIEFDADGPEAENTIRDIFGGEPLETFSVGGRRGIKRYYPWDDRFADLKAKHTVGDTEIRLSANNNLQSMVWGTTDDPDHDREHVRRFDPADVAKLARLPDAVVERIVAIVPKAAPTKAASDDPLSDLEAKLQMPRVLAALGGLSPSRADKYDDWLRVGAALKSLGEDYYPVFDSWSRQSAKYGGTRELWDSLDPNGGISVGTLYWMAEQDTMQAAEPSDLQLLPSIGLRELLDEPDEPIVPVVDGLMALGDVTAIIAAPKKQKSWFVMQMAASVAAGQAFLDRKVTQGSVLIYDNELRLRDLRRRFRATVSAMDLPESTLDRITLVSRKGQHTTIEIIRDDILGRIKQGEHFHLVVIDSLYKTFAPGTDENSTGDMIHVYAVLEEIAEKANCAVVIVHHATKGSQRGKSNTDIGSGSGVQSRSVDNHATIMPHDDEPDVFVFSATVRNFPPQFPFCIRYQYPLWETATDYTPEGRKPPTIDEFVATIPIANANKKDALKASREALKVSVADVEVLLGVAVDRGLVVVSIPDRKNEPHQIRRAA